MNTKKERPLPENYYAILDGKKVVPATSRDQVEKLLGNTIGRRVAITEFPDGSYISTVFLALNHHYGASKNLWFETIVFGGPLTGEMERYETWDEAEQGHALMVSRVEAAYKKER